MDFPTFVRRLKVRPTALSAGLLFLLVSGGALLSGAQTEEQTAREATEQAIETRQDTQRLQDEWAEEKAGLVQRYRAASASVAWLAERRDEEAARVRALDDRVAELQRRLGEADRLEGSMQDTLMVIFHRLEESVAGSLPFLAAERGRRLTWVSEELVRPDVTSAEKLRRLLEAMQVEAGYASTVEVYQDMLIVGGEEIHADVLRLGRVALFWRTPDGARVGHFDSSAGQWVELPGSQKRRIGLAMEMAARMRPIELIDLPLGRIEP